MGGPKGRDLMLKPNERRGVASHVEGYIGKCTVVSKGALKRVAQTMHFDGEVIVMGRAVLYLFL